MNSFLFIIVVIIVIIVIIIIIIENFIFFEYFVSAELQSLLQGLRVKRELLRKYSIMIDYDNMQKLINNS